LYLFHVWPVASCSVMMISPMFIPLNSL
jgi:hypothetical protein